MEHGFPVNNRFWATLAKNSDYINIILGTGPIARDLQTKLRLLGLNAPYLVGDRDDESAGIRHYKRLSEITDSTKYRFISCCDTNESALIGPSQSAVLKLLGTVMSNHPRFIQLTSNTVMFDSIEKVNDVFSLTNGLLQGYPYARYGDGGNAFKIQIWGGSTCRCICSYSQDMWPELMYGHLRAAGFNAEVYSWGQSLNSFSDCLLRFLRDGRSQNPDLVIFYTSAADLDPLIYKDKNMLATRSNERVNLLIRFMRSENMHTILGDISDGINHDADPVNLWAQRHRVMCALSKLFNFKFWNCLSPNPLTLPKEQAEKISGAPPGYLARIRRRKDKAVAASEEYGKVMDFTDVLTGTDDISSFYLDNFHLTNEGNELVARRFASEILAEFGRRTI